MDWLFDLIRTQGLAVVGVVVLFVILLKFYGQSLKDSKTREKKLNEFIVNDLANHAKILGEISEELKQGREEHGKMIELLIKISERVKRSSQ